MRAVVAFLAFLGIVYAVMLAGIFFFLVGAVIAVALVGTAIVCYLLDVIDKANEADRIRRGEPRRVPGSSVPGTLSTAIGIRRRRRGERRARPRRR